VRRMSASELAWMPKTCAYRRIHEGQPLPEWHPLVSGDPRSVFRTGVTVAGRTVSERMVDLEQLEAEIIEWVET